MRFVITFARGGHSRAGRKAAHACCMPLTWIRARGAPCAEGEAAVGGGAALMALHDEGWRRARGARGWAVGRLGVRAAVAQCCVACVGARW